MMRAVNACCSSVKGSVGDCSASGTGEFVAGDRKASANGLSLSCVGRPLST